jgi:peptidoglycan-associated lipoprotein
MRFHRLVVPVLSLALVATACSKKHPETAVAPTPAPPPAPAPTPPPPPPEAPRTTDNGNAEAARLELVRALEDKIHFEYDRDEVRQVDFAILDRKAAVLAANPGVKMLIEGHADERGSDEYNLVLGNKRAAAAKRYLVSKGIDASRLDLISYGEERPEDPASNETAWAKNRRDEFKITAGSDKLVAPR